MQIGFTHPGTSLGIVWQMMGSLKTVPPRMFLMVPFGESHIFLRPNSTTRSSSGVMVAHLMATLCLRVARAESMVTLTETKSLETFLKKSRLHHHYLIVGLVPVGQTKIIVQTFHIEVGKDELILDQLPNDPVDNKRTRVTPRVTKVQ
jgi:hypothetical protein